jgi:plasmid stability protein
MPSILVRGLDKRIIERLKERAKQNGRSLQGEAKRVLEEAASRGTWEEVRKGFVKWQEKFRGRKHPSIVEMLREDRER